MDQTQLQQKIAEYFAKLPSDAQTMFASMEWMKTLENLSYKYNLTPQQVENLGTETTLLLLGIVHPEDYTNFLQEELSISQKTRDALLADINLGILNKWRETLSKVYIQNANEIADEVPTPPSTPAPFAVKAPALNTELPPIQKDKEPEIANGQFDSQKELYTIAKEEKLSIEQMGKFEEVTNKIISGTIHPDQYEKMLESELGLTPEKAIELSNKTNEQVLLRMREEMKKAYPPQAQPEPKIPTPPYKQELKAPAPIAPKPIVPNTATSDDQMFTNSGVEVIQESPIPKNLPTTEAIIKEEEVMLGKDGVDIVEPNIQTPTPPIQTSPTTEQDTLAGIENPSKSKTHIISGEIPERKINVVQDRLSKPTISLQSASDQSPVSTTPTNSKDPYREPIE